MPYSVIIIAMLALFTLAGCGSEEMPETTDCQVVTFYAGSQKPVCAVHCSWWAGNLGFSNSTPVPCSWAKKKVYHSGGSLR